MFEEDLLICTKGNAGHHNRALHGANLVVLLIVFCCMLWRYTWGKPWENGGL
jgi:hypothetical protein